MIGLDIDTHRRHPQSLRDAVTEWARAVTAIGGIIEVHLKNEAGTLCDVLELDLDDQGNRYLAADRQHVQTAPWRRDVPTPPFPAAALVSLG